MSPAPTYVVITGLPGSGKSNVGLALTAACRSLIDKDVILESLLAPPHPSLLRAALELDSAIRDGLPPDGGRCAL